MHGLREGTFLVFRTGILDDLLPYFLESSSWYGQGSVSLFPEYSLFLNSFFPEFPDFLLHIEHCDGLPGDSDLGRDVDLA